MTPVTLPLVRDELRLLPADANRDGTPAWMVHDPVCNRFYRIGWMDLEMLARWSRGTPDAVAQAVNEETTLAVEPRDVLSLALFLEQHSLLQARGAAAVDALRRRAHAQKKGIGTWLLHHYLFFRLPLVRPQDLLARAIPWLRWVFTPAAWWGLSLTSLLGILLVARQWDTFAGTFVDHLSLQGMVGFAAAMALAKTLHEMGHALTATRYGVRVAHMGVAMVVLFPMLYTDTSESWKLTNPRQRLAIASAGILTELAIAGVATLLWALSPEGWFRSAMFLLATTTWVMTLLVNASPFMRFDGYFILSDVLNFPNLHERAGAVARAWVRRALLGMPEPWPEDMPPVRRRWLAVFALATWAYRLAVFLGIAVLVYVFFFKALGIFMFLVEIGWFIVRPVHSEMKVWWTRRDEIAPSRKRAAAGVVLALLLIVLLPWWGGVHGVGVVHAARQHQVFAPREGQITALPPSAQVGEGEVIFALASPDLRKAQQRSQALADARASELLGLSGLKDGEERRALLQSEREKFLAEAGVYGGEQSRMQLVAPFAGRLLDLDPLVRPGVWVQPRQPLAVLIDPSAWVADAYVAEEDVSRLRPGDKARVSLGHHRLAPIGGTVLEIDAARTAVLPYALLDASSGGPIVTLPRTGERGAEHVPRDGLFRVRIALDEAPPQERMLLSSVTIWGERRSLLHGVLDSALSVLIRESGF